MLYSNKCCFLDVCGSRGGQFICACWKPCTLSRSHWLGSVLYTGLCFRPHVLSLSPKWKERGATAQEDLLWQWQVGERKRARLRNCTCYFRPHVWTGSLKGSSPEEEDRRVPSTSTGEICRVTWQWALDPWEGGELEQIICSTLHTSWM